MATSRSDRLQPALSPTSEELAAIVAAVTVAWPAPPLPPPTTEPSHRPAGWRFSGRWWAPDDVLRRAR